MKKSRIIALFTAAMMIMSAVPSFAAGYFVDEDGAVYEKDGENLVSNPGFEEGLFGLTDNDEYYEVTQEAAHSGTSSLKAIKSTKGDGAITAYFEVENPSDSYYLSFWYKNIDTIARRPRVTFAFTDATKAIPTTENDFTEATNAWVGAGTASNDQDMEYSTGDWVKYSTVITGTGSATACNYAVLHIYGLTKDVSFVDDFEIYALAASEEYGDTMASAVEKWEKVTMPKGPLAGFGSLNLPNDTGVEGIDVKWISSSETINTETGEYASGSEEELVILTARLYAENNEEVYFDFEYPYIVKSMFVPYVEWMKSEVFTAIGSSVSADLTLPTTHSIAGYHDAEITWSCSDESIITSDGKFTAPETTCDVDLVATITCNGSSTSLTKRVKALGGHIVADGLIMYYDFEKALSKSTLYDNSRSEVTYDAKVEGITLVDGYARFAGGASTITLPSNYATELTDSYSVSMWVKVDKTIANHAGMYRFFDFGGTAYTSQFLRYIPSTGQLSFMDRGTAADRDSFALSTTASGFGDTWKLVSFVYDFAQSPALATVYVDGVKIADSSGNSTLKNSVYTVATQYSDTGYIGRTQWNDGDNPDFMGYMDDVRIYNRAITAEEISTLYEQTRPTVVAPVTIKYQDVNGETLKDDITLSVDVNTTYDVPVSYKSIPSTSNGQYRYVYNYIASKSTDSVYVSEDSENVCILVFEREEAPMGTNLLANPGFEEGVDGWTSNNNGSLAPITGWIRTTDVAHEGNYSLKRNSDVGKNDPNNFGTYIPIESGKVYNFSFWEYCDSNVAAGDHMMSAVCIAANQSAVGDTANHLLQYGGYSSWVNEANGTPPRDVAYYQGWTQRTFTFDTTGATNANYIFVAYTWKAGGVFCVDDFVLEEVSEYEGPVEDDGEKYEIIIKYQDAEGNTLKDDVVAKANLDTVTYEVPASYKTLANKTEGASIYMYTFNEELSSTKVNPSILKENICTLVFDVIMVDATKNLVPDGDFTDDNGNFSWGTWESPRGDGYFSNIHSDYFYMVNRDTNAAVLDKTSLVAEDYALGTRWNDGTDGLCSMANFIEVKAGKTYIVSYDYKHKTAGTDASYISTSFQKTKTLSAGATGMNIPKNVSTEWQTNIFEITAPSDGYIYFHFSYVGSGGGSNPSSNAGTGPYWYFDNVAVYEVEEEIIEAEIKSVSDTETQVKISNTSEEDEVLTLTVYVASYNEEGILTGVNSVDVVVEAGEDETVTLEVGEDKTVKAFLWEGDMKAAFKTLVWEK